MRARSVSLVIPVCNEEANIREICRRLNLALEPLGIVYEIIFVDDGSSDGTSGLIKSLRAKDGRIKLVKFLRNYGQVIALLSGFGYARGDALVAMDADLQNDPADIPKLLEKINSGFDLVNGWRYCRKDHFLRRLISLVERWLIWLRTGIRMQDYGSGFFALSRGLVDKLNSYGYAARFIKPLAAKLAGSFAEVRTNHCRRAAGCSKYNFFKIAVIGFDFLFNFSSRRKGSKLPCQIEELNGIDPGKN